MSGTYLRRLLEDLRLKNLAKNTCDDYYRFVKRFLEFTGKEAMPITYAGIRRFIFHMKDHESQKASTINVYTAAIRFFFEYTLGYVWDHKKIPKMKRDRQLPVILTREQVVALIGHMDNYKHKAVTSTMYSSGLRVSGVCHLRYGDIRRPQMMVHVPLSKNRQDRYTALSEHNLGILTEYWYRYGRPKGWLSPSTVRDAPLTTDAVWLSIRKHARAPGLPEGATPHTLRHCSACHSLEGGVRQPYIYPTAPWASQPAFHGCVPADGTEGHLGIRSPSGTFGKGGMGGCNDGR